MNEIKIVNHGKWQRLINAVNVLTTGEHAVDLIELDLEMREIARHGDDEKCDELYKTLNQIIKNKTLK